MLKSLVKAFGLIAVLALSGTVYAVGMGGINLTSALGEPLNAEIELVSVGKAEKGSLSARLASADVFKGAGIEYPGNLPKLKFQIETRASGEPYLKVTSIQPVNEPFISLLVELSWSSGKLLREYTFLLDPPEFKAEQPKAAEVKPVLSKAEGQVEPGVAARQMRSTAPMDEKMFAEAAATTAPAVAAPVPARKPAESSNVVSGVIRVKRGDTLSGIALQSKPSDVSLERMLVALYRANADAFDGKNMNRLRTGKILRMPEQPELGKLAQIEAVKEIRAQVADWHAYKQKLAAASGTAAEQAPRQEASGKISTTVADKAPAAKESAKEVVRLSKGEAPGDKAVVSGNAKAMQDKIHTLEEEAIARGKALKESNERVVLLEKNIKEMQHLVELKGQQVALAKPAAVKAEEVKPETKPAPAKVEAKPTTPAPFGPVAASQPPVTPAVAASAVAPASAVKPAKPAKPAAKPVAPPPPSMLDDPLLLAGGAAALLALGGLGFVLIRRSKGSKADKKAPEGSQATEDAGSSTGHISAPVAPSPETGDFTQGATAAPVGTASVEDVDPVSEAELFLNFGRDAQAEEILKDALEKDPANNRIQLKLLAIYAGRKDINSFSGIARKVQNSGDTAAWAQAAEMGRNLEPNNPMYGGTGGEAVAAPVDQGKIEQQPAAGLDFDLGFGAPEAGAATANESTVVLTEPLGDKTASASGLDFDLGLGAPEEAATTDYESTMVLNAPVSGAAQGNSSEVTIINTSEDLRFAQEAPMDFDVTAPVSGAVEKEQAADITPNLDDLVFDITSTHPSETAMTEEKAAADVPVAAGDTIAFTLDFPTEGNKAPAQSAAKEAVDFDLSGIDLDLGESAVSASAPAADAKDAHWHDVATKLDLAKAYQEMGDNAGAREILDEVLAEGDEQQRAAAEAILQQLLA